MLLADQPKLITVPLREFARPAPRCGSIESAAGSDRAAAEGREIHLRIQKRRAKADPSYRAEVPISASFPKDGFLFRVEGRMDGIFAAEIPLIEEIKSSFHLPDLARRLTDDPLSHPYGLQLLSYGYFHYLDSGVPPRLTFHLVSTRSSESRDLELPLDIPAYRQWLDLRLAELSEAARLAEKRADRRRKMAQGFAFPFAAPRPGQLELMREIELGMEQGAPLLVQAPTGLGKTVGVLYPVLKEALARGQRVIYLTPKNSLHAVAEDAVTRFKESGTRVKSLSITAKAKICFLDEPLCQPQSCEYAREYYTKLREQGVLELLAKKRKLKARHFRALGEEHKVCPFELQLDAAEEADVVICDYNYVFAPRSASKRLGSVGVDQSGKPNLVIDEAHNLPARAMEQYSPALAWQLLEARRDELRRLPAALRAEAEALLDGCLAPLAACREQALNRPARVAPPVASFREQDLRLRAFLSRYLESGRELDAEDPVLRLCFYWSAFTETLAYLEDPDRREFFTTFHPQAHGGTLKITCCDASSFLTECYQQFAQVVGFSATLKPFAYYAQLSGLASPRLRLAEFPSPFPPEKRKLLIIPQISTKYSDRERNYGKIAEAVRRIASLRPGNYFVFFPSFEFLERVAALFSCPEGFVLLQQERNMKGAQVEAVLERLRLGAEPTLVLAVQGGSFSEGVDYAGEMAVGAFVVGPPLPKYDLEREEMRGYYQLQYGAGFDYAYVIPAMAKAVQAAGRVIRSETDRGIVVLMDGRFLEPGYHRAMPADWFESRVTELVSEGILKEVAEFWQG